MFAGLLRGTLVMSLCACAQIGDADVRPRRPSPVDAGTPTEPAAEDADDDGLCDTSEAQLGTDPNAADTDQDGLPDLIEIGNGFEPVDPADPAVDQIGYLPSGAGASLEFPIRATVVGDGQGVTGFFAEVGSLYFDDSNAGDFLTSVSAVSAAPTDAVRSINNESSRFAAVLGKTRLEFKAYFEYPSSLPVRKCTRTYPFRYVLKQDDSTVVAERLYLLVVRPLAKDGEFAPHCLPSDCQ
jgi:hypothetical protein